MPRNTAPLLALLIASACTNADLMVVAPPEIAVPRVRADATVCAPAPLSELAPYKILFVIDTSYSNSWTDPTPQDGRPRREQAVRDVINLYLDYRNVFFGVITFSDVPKRQTFGYIGTTTQTDRDILDGATANIAQAQGGTNYGDTLWTAIDFVMTDVRSLSEAEALNTHYLVFWLSDGFPTVGIVDPDSILPGVGYLESWMASRVAEFRFNTAFMGGGDQAVPTAEQDLAKQLLRQMAGAGAGEFTDVEGGQPVSFAVSLAPVLRRFVLQSAIATNRHTVLGTPRPFADSDGDGLVDLDELDVGLDPTLSDTDGDGFGDGVELAVALAEPTTLVSEGGAVALNPVRFDEGCDDAAADADHDGLSDCDERLLGINPTNVDSDGDLIPDPIELHLGGLPMRDDPAFDFDLDLVPDEEELRGHLAPQEHNSASQIAQWSYRYLVAEVGEGAAAGERCYAITVANVAVFDTEEGEDHARGQNDLELWVAFAPEDGGGPTLFRRAISSARYLLDLDVLSPASGRLQLVDGDFETLPVAAGSAEPD